MIESEEIEVKVPLAHDLYRYIKQNYLLASSLVTAEYFTKDDSIWVEGNTAERNLRNLPRTRLIIHNAALTSEKWNAVLKEIQKILIKEYHPIIQEVRIMEEEMYHILKIIGANWHA